MFALEVIQEYLGSNHARARAVVGSANLTGGLATNLEAAVALHGVRDDVPLARAWEWAEALWSDDRVKRWTPQVAERLEESFEPELYKAFKAEVERSPLFLTLGPRPRKNRVVELTPV